MDISNPVVIDNTSVPALGRFAFITASGNFQAQKTGNHLVYLQADGAGGGGGGGAAAGAAGGAAGGQGGGQGLVGFAVLDLVEGTNYAVVINSGGAGGAGGVGGAGNPGMVGSGCSFHGAALSIAGGAAPFGGGFTVAANTYGMRGDQGDGPGGGPGGSVKTANANGNAGSNATSYGGGGGGGGGGGAGASQTTGGNGGKGGPGFCLVLW